MNYRDYCGACRAIINDVEGHSSGAYDDVIDYYYENDLSLGLFRHWMESEGGDDVIEYDHNEDFQANLDRGKR